MSMHRFSAFIAALFLASQLFAVNADAEDWTNDWATCKTAVGENAIASCSRLIGSGRLNAQLLAIAYNNRGNARALNRDLDDAIADFNQALRYDAKLVIAYSNRCLARAGKGDFDSGIADCNQAIVFNPNLASAFENRCAGRLGKSDFDGAIADCTQAIRLDPKRATVFGVRCSAQLGKGDFNAAVADCDQAIKLNPKLVIAYNNRCFAWAVKGDPNRAVADCDRAIQLNPKLAPAFGNRCYARLTEGANDTALLDCNQAIELDPDYTGAYVNRGTLFERTGDIARAISDFQLALARPPKYVTGSSFQDIARKHLTSLGIVSQTKVPLLAAGARFVVPVKINGAITLNFIVDSGADDVTLPSDVVSTLIRTGTIEPSDFTGTETYILADGSSSPSTTFTIKSLRVGDMLVENVKASIAPPAADLLLGQSFLRKFKSWAIDNAKHELLLEPR